MMQTTSKAVALAKSDTTDYTGIKQIYVGGTGDLVVRFTRDPGTSITLKAVPVGFVLSGSITRVMAATTATDLVGFY